MSVHLQALPDLHLCPLIPGPCLFLLFYKALTTCSVPKTLHLPRRKGLVSPKLQNPALNHLFKNTSNLINNIKRQQNEVVFFLAVNFYSKCMLIRNKLKYTRINGHGIRMGQIRLVYSTSPLTMQH